MSRAVPVGSGGDPDTGSGTLLHRVGPDGSLPSDAQFAIALTSLWHAVSEAGGAVGFNPGRPRPQVARRVAGVMDSLRRGRSTAVAVTIDRILVGFGQLIPGEQQQAHTGEVTSLMVDPDQQRSGLGGALMESLLDRARSAGLQRVSLSVRDDLGLEKFCRRFGFVIGGRRPGWIRAAGMDTDRPVDHDEVFFTATL